VGGPRILRSARKYHVSEADIRHAWDNAVRLVEYEYDGEDRLLVLGPSRTGAILELVAVPVDGPSRIIHADRLQPSREHYLR